MILWIYSFQIQLQKETNFMEQKANQTEKINTYYKDVKEDSLEAAGVQPVLNHCIKKKILYSMLIKGIINQPTSIR